MKLTAELVVAIPVAIIWSILGIICLLWDLPGDEFLFGGVIVHVAFYLLTGAGAFAGFVVLVENSDDIAQWWNDR